MRDRALWALALLIVSTAFPCSTGVAGPETPPGRPRKVLVELYTSQGCDASPAGSQLLGKLAGMGFEGDQIVPINFHVDTHNSAWADPYADAAFARRQRDDYGIARPGEPDSVPLMRIDSRPPVVGSDRAKVEAAIHEALESAPVVDLGLRLEGAPTRKTLTLKIAGRSPSVAGRELRVCVALTEDPVSTRVRTGENAGRTLVEHHVVRRFDQKLLTLDRSGPRSLAFPIELPEDGVGSRFRVVGFVQDRETGAIHQADSTAWSATRKAVEIGPVIARRKAKRPAPNFSGFDPFFWNEDGSMTCPACGNSFMPPLAPIHVKPGQMILVPTVSTC